jgi:hypothetical protein
MIESLAWFGSAAIGIVVGIPLALLRAYVVIGLACVAIRYLWWLIIPAAGLLLGIFGNTLYPTKAPAEEIKQARPVKWPMLLIPPATWDHPYHGVLTVIRGDQEAIDTWCHITKRLGCAHVYQGGCDIMIGNDDLLEQWRVNYLLVYRHEIGHCNGWPGDHPTSPPVARSPLEPIPIPTKPEHVPVVLLNIKIDEATFWQFSNALTEYALRRAKELGLQ